jgi:uncharacterized SAM-binding protein YcdF (DUF218 family)
MRKRLLRILLIGAGVWLLIACALGLTVIAYAGTDRAETADVIVVLGAGLRRNGEPGPALTRRSVRAAELYAQGYAPAILCSGGYPLRSVPRSEAEGCRDVLIDHGVPPDAIWIEDQSRSTEENAVYTREIMTANGWDSALIVSDGYHLLRAGWIFQQLGIHASSSPASAPPTFNLLTSVAREVVALHWQVVKTILNLPFSYVPWL